MGFSAGVGFLVDTDGDGTNDGKVVTLKKGSNITLSLTGSTLTISSTGGGGGSVRTVTAGGNTLTIAANPTSSGTTAFLDFSDVTWSSSSITARSALIYKSGGSNPAIAVIDFGADKQTS